jgi:hypothetical protein
LVRYSKTLTRNYEYLLLTLVCKILGPGSNHVDVSAVSKIVTTT